MAKNDDSWKLFKKDNGLFYGLYDSIRNNLSKMLVDYILNNCKKKSKLVVVEAGSGPGYGSVIMSKRKEVVKSIAMDHDSRALQQNDYTSSKFEKKVGDLVNLPFDDKSVDIIWNSSTMEHLSDNDFDTSINEINRVLKDDGFVFIGVPYKFGPLGFSLILTNSIKEWVGKLFTKNDLIGRLRNFKVISSKIYFFGFFIGIILKKNIKGIGHE